MVTPPKSQGGADRTPAGFSLELERSVDAPAIARAAASGLCHDLRINPSMRHTCMLLVSEVVSNAVRHSDGPPDAPIRLTAEASEDAVRITVTDAGTGFTPQIAGPGRPDGGYGLYLLERAARSWGTDSVGGTRVWFELPRGD
jgi:signal transduction histidine kinase